MKKNILLLLLLFVFNCDSGDSGSSPNNCEVCPETSLSSIINLTPNTNYIPLIPNTLVWTAQVGIPASDDFILSLSIEAKMYNAKDCNSTPK